MKTCDNNLCVLVNYWMHSIFKPITFLCKLDTIHNVESGMVLQTIKNKT